MPSCTGAAPAPHPSRPTPPSVAAPWSSPPPRRPALEAEPEQVAQVSAQECAPGPGRTVTELEDVVVEGVVVPEVRTADSVVDGQTVPGVVVPGYTLPAQVADAGCTVRVPQRAGRLPARGGDQLGAAALLGS